LIAMLALVCGHKTTLVRDRAEPVRAPGEALIEMQLAGVCDTDLQLSRGYMGFTGVLGHEFVGRVLESDDPSLRGRRVVGDINAGCGRCVECRENRGHHCKTRTVLGIVLRDGALAERFTMPERCLVAVPDDVGDESAVFAEPLAAALHVVDEIPESAERAVVIGDGKLGLLVAYAVRSSGQKTVLVGHHEKKLAIARAFGVDTVLERDIGRDLDGAPVVVDATGSSTGLALALRLVEPRGTVVLKTTVAGSVDVDLSPIVVNELRVVGSRCGDMAEAVRALADRRVDPTRLIEARFPLARADEALGRAAEPGTLKVLVHG
jgi:threonine dehydrogenase-like Zn-dependent dehydrogenase